MKIDAHHHLWHYSPGEYDWIDDRMQALRRDFMPSDLEREMEPAHVQATVVVQARQTLGETSWLLDLAAKSNFIHAVVGWAPIAANDFPEKLDALLGNPKLKGLRHVVQGENVNFLDGAEFNRGIAAMRDTGLIYDLLIVARQLVEATRFVSRHPQQIFVLDHIAKPDIANDQFAAWDCEIRALASHENVFCKLSGMVTEADWHRWSSERLRPYFETALDAFGPSRLMAGSDWPVLTVACSYQDWWKTVESWIAPLSHSERAEIKGGVAGRVYQIHTDEQLISVGK
jgi:L-fuconolactonase